MIDWPLIEKCAELCLASYEGGDGFTHVGDLCFGIHDFSNGQRIITIRGTANAKNWLRDADVMPIRSCAGRLAHKGFVQAYRKLCSGGLPTVNDRPGIVATGHSLGGGVATLLAEHIGCKLVTFGSPRVYFRFSRAPKLDHTRVVCDDDPVPMVPRFLYSHRQAPILLKDYDRGFIDVQDHFMAHYLKMVRQARTAI